MVVRKLWHRFGVTKQTKTKRNDMTTLENITNQMVALEVEIARQQAYIMNHGDNNDKGDFDEQWEQYKVDAQYNLDKWDSMKKIRNELKNLSL